MLLQTNGIAEIMDYGDRDDNVKPHYEEKEGLLAVEKCFNLLNVLTHKVNGKTLEHQMINIWRNAYAFANRCCYNYTNRMRLSGTPLNETMVALHQILPQFKKENNVEKVQCIVLTDGEGSQIPYHKMVKRIGKMNHTWV